MDVAQSPASLFRLAPYHLGSRPSAPATANTVLLGPLWSYAWRGSLRRSSRRQLCVLSRERNLPTMAPANGVTTKIAKTGPRQPSKPVIPVLPLTYPQRPTPKQTSAPQKSSPLADARNQEAAQQQQERQVDSSAEAQPPPSALGMNSDSHDGSTPVQNGSAGTSPAAPADPSIALAGNALAVAPSGTPARGTLLASPFSHLPSRIAQIRGRLSLEGNCCGCSQHTPRDS